MGEEEAEQRTADVRSTRRAQLPLAGVGEVPQLVSEAPGRTRRSSPKRPARCQWLLSRALRKGGKGCLAHGLRVGGGDVGRGGGC